jgi:hypothetical protein
VALVLVESTLVGRQEGVLLVELVATLVVVVLVLVRNALLVTINLTVVNGSVTHALRVVIPEVAGDHVDIVLQERIRIVLDKVDARIVLQDVILEKGGLRVLAALVVNTVVYAMEAVPLARLEHTLLDVVINVMDVL